MAKKIQDGKLFYHVTALKNLENIFRNELLSREASLKKGLLKVDIADSEIIEKRKELGILQYVPFHFFEPTPFTGAIFANHPDKSFCSITILRDFAKTNNFKICTSHPLLLNPKAEVLEYQEGLRKINWAKAEARNYNDDISKNSCMAECLASSPVSPDNFFTIYVADETTQKYVDTIATKILGDYKFYIDINSNFSKARIW